MTVPYRPSSGISPGRDHPLASGPPRLAGQPAMCQAWRPATCVAGLPSCLALFSGAPVCCVDCSGGGDFGAARTRHTASAGGPHRLHAPRAAGRRAAALVAFADAALVAFSPSVRAWGAAACGWRPAGSVGLLLPAFSPSAPDRCLPGLHGRTTPGACACSMRICRSGVAVRRHAGTRLVW